MCLRFPQESEDVPLAFDPTRCAECIAIGGGNSSVRQVVDKTWGVVITTTGFAPNTGLHAWDVKLKQCDKSYVCLGVATRDASTAMHLGGDKHGCAAPLRWLMCVV